MKSVFSYALENYQQQLALKKSKENLSYFAYDILKIHEHVNNYMTEIEIRDLGKHHYEWLGQLQQLYEKPNKKRIVLVAPRDHWKTTICSIIFPLWRFLHGETGYIFSNSMEQSKDILAKTAHLIDLRDFYDPEKNGYDMDSFPYIVPRAEKKQRLIFTNGSSYIAKSFGSSARGPHPHFIVCDDPLQDPEKGVSSARLAYVDRYYFGTIVNMIAPGGIIIVTGTPQTFNDLLMRLLQNEEYTRKKYQAVLNYDTGEVLWPEVYSFDLLMQRRREIGSLAFDREFMTNPLDESSSLFPYTLVSECFDPDLTLMHAYRGKELKIFIGCDLAISAQTGADFFVIVVLGVDNLGNRYVLDIFREKGLTYKSQVQAIQYFDKRYLPKKFYVEDNSFQRIIRDMVRDTSSVPVQGYTTGRKKADLAEGVPSLRVHFENKKYKIPRNNRKPLDWHRNQTSAEITDVLVRELAAFSYIEGKVEGLGEHDDTVMALWFAEEAIREWEGKKIKVAPVDLFGKR